MRQWPGRPVPGSGRAPDGGWDVTGTWSPPEPIPAAAECVEPPGGALHPPGRVAASIATFVLVAGLALGAITTFRLLRSSADVLSTMVPATSAAYATVYLQPSGSQELALSELIARFPALSSPSQRSQGAKRLMTGILAGTGLSAADVVPWLGPQLGVSVSSEAPSGSTAPFSAYALYVSTTSTSQTQAALRRYRAHMTSSGGAAHRFSTRDYHGVSVTTVADNPEGVVQGISCGLAGGGNGAPCPASPAPGATPTSSWQTQFAYAVVQGVLVMAGSPAYLEQIIDTQQGRDPAIAANADYQRVLGQLPSDRLGLLFLDYPSLLHLLGAELRGSASAPARDALAALRPYRGFGVSAEAVSGGLAVDATLDLDPAQLTADERALLSVPPDHSTAAGMTPAGAVAFYGFAGTQYVVRELVDSLEGTSSGVAGRLGQSGLGTFLGYLDGDLGVELDDANGSPAGGLIVGTTHPAATLAFLNSALPSLVDSLGAAGPTCAATPPASAASCSAQPVPAVSTYRGVSISEIPLPRTGVTLAWTVMHGEAVLATSPAEVRAIIDARDGAPSLAGSPGYAGTAGRRPATATGYVSMPALLTLIRASLPPGSRRSFDQNVLPNLRPISSISLTDTASPSQSIGHIFIRVP